MELEVVGEQKNMVLNICKKANPVDKTGTTDDMHKKTVTCQIHDHSAFRPILILAFLYIHPWAPS